MMTGLSPFEQTALWTVLGVSFLGLAYAYYLMQHVLLEPTGDGPMLEVWNAIRVGAKAYLSRQLKSILPLMAALTVALFFSVYIVPPSREALLRFPSLTPDQIRLTIGFARAVAFLLGAGFSMAVGQWGMRMAVHANVRVAQASRKGFGEALRVAYRAGTFTGMLTDGLGLLGGTVIFMILGVAAPDALLGFGFGGTLIALFMRVGGGIYTKAADVGADLVGKVEAGIPEDDPRNPAVIADLVGDNVGDCAGMAADIFESYEVTIVSGLILGLALFQLTGRMEWVIYPLLVRAVGVVSSILGTYLVKARPGDKGNAMPAILRGFLISATNSIFFFGVIGWYYLQDTPCGWWRPVLSTTLGVILAVVLFFLTSYFTEVGRGPVNEIKDATHTGPATTIITGLSVGFESTVWSILVIALTLMIAIAIFGTVPGATPGTQLTYILYGVALTGIGMLTLTGDNLAMDSFGPISDNANGIGEMAWSGRKDKPTLDARRVMDSLDQAGNATKAITKGVAIGSAVIAAVALFGSFIVNVSAVQEAMKVPLSEQLVSIGIRVSSPSVLVGMLIGGGLPWLFSCFALKAVGRAASLIVDEVRKQFKAGVLTRKIKPNYYHVVSICTWAAQHELVSMALLGVLTPILVGLVLQAEALGGFLAGVILSGQLLAVFMANSGGAWDNAKKAIEEEPKNPKRNLGKGSERHKAAVVGDTVGDPLKDTAGPALNPMIKVVNLISVIIAPIVVQYPRLGVTGWIFVLILLGVLAWSVRQSKKPVSARLGRESESF
ncbi:MAG TPA: sodium-translocating pyrophosphatase [bacterium]|nr:sodium-translocating pyrophosphatase [bacterium]